MDTKALLTAFKQISDRLTKLEKIGIPKDGKTPVKGVDYFDGKDGVNGKDGKDGIDGKPGKDGKDFTFDMFTPEQLQLLKGERGNDGLNGKDGKDGRPGRDGKDGLPGADGKQGVPGKDGKDGKNGRPGIRGKDGEDGRGIEDVYIDKNGHLIIVFTDGEKKDVGRVVGKDGANGMGFSGPQGRPGRDGEDGKDGADGQDGISVTNAKIDSRGHLIVTLSDGRQIDAGYVGSGGGGGNVSSDTISKIWTGTQEEYDALPKHHANTLYFILKEKPVEPTKAVYNRFNYNSGVKYNEGL